MGAFGPPWVSTFILPANTPTGSGFSIVVPNGHIWHLLSVFVTFNTSATVVNRVLYALSIDAGGNFYTQTRSSYNQTANGSVGYEFAVGFPAYLSGDSTLIHLPLADLLLPQGFQLQVNAVSLQVGDAILNVRIAYEDLSYG